jgi:hypothetical protein
MPIMSYEEWKRRTKLAIKPRSSALKYLDACLKAYDDNRGSPSHFDALVLAFQSWAGTKADVEGSERNWNGGVTELLAQLVDFRDQHMPFAHRGHTFRPPSLMQDIREGAKLLHDGKLKPQVSVHIPVGVVDSSKGTVRWEEFEDSHLRKARKAWSDAYEAARTANNAIGSISRDPKQQERFQRWFGTPNAGAVDVVRRGLLKMWMTFQSNPVTIVLREDITVHLVNGDDPFGEMEESFSGSDVYGYVWQHQGGSGYRIIMGKWFLSDPDPIEGAAQTIYHELTHKVLKTVDHGYGKIKSRGYAAASQQNALTNADNWAYYAISFLKEI